MPLFVVPISDLQALVDPLDGKMWKCRPIDKKEVLAAVEAGSIESRSWNDVVNTIGEEESRKFHIDRIATLVRDRNSEKIIVTAENHRDPAVVYVNDGNHRLAAAYIRGDATITAVLACGVPGRETDVFPGATPA